MSQLLYGRGSMSLNERSIDMDVSKPGDTLMPSGVSLKYELLLMRNMAPMLPQLALNKLSF
jgi:hypothetical protein